MKDSARDTLTLVERGAYRAHDGTEVDFAAAQRAAEAGTRLYTPERLAALTTSLPPGGDPPVVEVWDATTQVAARRLVEAGVTDLALLNFASARNPGGGFLNGARAQEEDLCRCSGLYPTLVAQRDYYATNRRQPSLLYTDHLIYSPAVPFFRVKGSAPLVASPFLCTVLTMPAPNLGNDRARRRHAPDVRDTFARRWRQLLAVAAHHRHRTLLLGAWGCGAFGNDPEVAASTAAEALADTALSGHLARVVFAIPDTGRQSAHNHAVFRRVCQPA